MEAEIGGSGVIEYIKTFMKKLGFFIVLILTSLAFAFFGWAFRNSIVERDKSISDGRFAQLELALLMYHNDNGSFPPVVYQRKTSEPLHSWRVLLLPYFTPDLQKAYNEYDFSKEWNSSENQKSLGDHAPPFYRFNKSGVFAQYISLAESVKLPTRKSLNCRIVIKGKDSFFLIENLESQIIWPEPNLTSQEILIK